MRDIREKISGVIKKIRPLDIVVIVGVVNILAIVFALWMTKGSFLSEIVWDARHGMFCDFRYPQLLASERHPYSADNLDAQYPALAYFFFYFIKNIIPDAVEYSTVSDWYNLFCVITICFCSFCITYLAERIMKNCRGTFGVLAVFFLSLPFAFAEIKSGNSTIFVLVLVLFALYLREQDSIASKELALIFIAIAAGLKMTPAIWGLLYVKEKRWGETIRLVIYGIISFIMPFFFFGRDAFGIYLEVSSTISTQLRPRPETLMGVCLEIGDISGLGLETGRILGLICSVLFLAIAIAAFFFTKTDWKSILLLTNLMIVFINGAYPYTLQYMLIPVVYFAVEEFSSNNKGIMLSQYIYSILLAMVLTSYPFVRIDWPTATFITNYFWLYILLIVVCIEKIVTCCRNKWRIESAW